MHEKNVKQLALVRRLTRPALLFRLLYSNQVRHGSIRRQHTAADGGTRTAQNAVIPSAGKHHQVVTSK